MSTQKKISKKTESRQNQYAILGAILLTVIVIGVGFISYYAGRRESTEQQFAPTPIMDVSKYSSSQILGVETHNWQGTIIATDESSVTFSALSRNKSGKIETTEMIAHVLSNTRLLRWDLTAPTPAVQSIGGREAITLKDLTPGNQIVVRASGGADSNNEISATDITMLLTPTKK